MNNKYIWITVGIIVLLVIIYVVYKMNKQNTITVPVSTITPKGNSGITSSSSGIVSNYTYNNAGTSERFIVLSKGRNI